MALADDIELLVFRSPGVTEAELAKELFGNRGYQQRVNSTCRRLIQQGRVMRHGNGGPGDPFTYHPGLSKPSGGRQKQMSGPAYERGVAVGGRLQNIIVYQKTKAVWVATGKYMDDDHQAEGQTANAAAKRWQQWATYKGNG